MTPEAALQELRDAADRPGDVANRYRGQGKRIVWTLGADIPRELIDAFGHCPVRLVPDARIDDSAMAALVGSANLGKRGRALLAAIAVLPREDALLISHTDVEQPQIFATLRELARSGAIPTPRAAFLDLLTTDKPAVRRYNRIRVAQAADWLAQLGGQADYDVAFAAGNAMRRALREALLLRATGAIDAADAHRIVAASAVLEPDEAATLLRAVSKIPARQTAGEARLAFLTGSLIEDPATAAACEGQGYRIVGEDHAWGETRAYADLREGDDALATLAHSTLSPRSGPFCDVERRATMLVDAALGAGASHVLLLTSPGDEASPWQRKAMACAAQARGLNFAAIDLALQAPPPAAAPAAKRPPPGPARSRKSLAAVAQFATFQREWFADLRRKVADGSPFAAVNANNPQETLRALGLPFVVNQWWASIVAAKQQTGRYAALLDHNGLPSDVEAYSAQGVAAAFDADAELAPWGGLPRPNVVSAILSTDATASIFQAWAGETGARLQTFERSIESRWDIKVDWWDGLADEWEHYVEAERLDLMESELRASISELESITGLRFDGDRFERVLDLVNEQQEYYRATRALVARTVPAPIGIVDSMPATMVPQWHRGTEWARDAASAFHDEVTARVEAGEAACPGEKLRLMFVGRGLWSDMGFYQRWEESHGAVFVWSMYLALAADGYIRRHDRGRDPMRALAARFVTMGDELRMPTWAGAWHVKEAHLHQVDGVVALSDGDPLVLRALREAGFAVLELGIDNYALESAADEVDRRMRAFLEGPVAEARSRRA